MLSAMAKLDVARWLFFGCHVLMPILALGVANRCVCWRLESNCDHRKGEISFINC